MAFVVDGAERMRELIDDLLQYSRIDTKTREFSSMDMNQIAGQVIDLFHVGINESKASVMMDLLPTVWGDGVQIVQVLTNLLSNAIKFRSKEPPRIVVFAHHGDHEWIIGVQDNGIGIDPKYHQNLFKMFQRLHTQDEYPGTGIGLAIAKKIVERHGGRIWFESELGTGSTFYFTISEK
jgi:light-regulated signal transduction histidine kinase (bacteriophytochrome)